MLKFGNVMSTSASSVKRKFLKDNKITFNEKKEFITVEDYDFFLNLASKKANFFFISVPLGFHYFHKESASSNKKKHINSSYKVLKHHSYNIQKFSLNKKKFYLSCKSNLDFKDDLIDIINKKKVMNVKIIKILKTFFKNPNEKIYILFLLIRKKVINSLKFYKFTKKNKSLASRKNDLHLLPHFYQNL